MTITEFIEAAAHNKIIQLVVLAIVCDTVFGVLRAIKEKKFNSCAGIDGAIRKVGMLISLVFMLAIDVLINPYVYNCTQHVWDEFKRKISGQAETPQGSNEKTIWDFLQARA